MYVQLLLLYKYMDSEIACHLALLTETLSIADGKLFFVEVKDNLFEI